MMLTQRLQVRQLASMSRHLSYVRDVRIIPIGRKAIQRRPISFTSLPDDGYALAEGSQLQRMHRLARETVDQGLMLHLSKVLVLVSCFTDDLPTLRSVLMCSSIMSVTFHFLFPFPRPVRMGWGFVFAMGHCYALMHYLKENADLTSSFSSEELAAWENTFSSHVAPQCFQRLLALAEKREIKKGEYLTGPTHTGDDKSENEMILVLSGKVEFHVGGKIVTYAKAGDLHNVPILTKEIITNKQKKPKTLQSQFGLNSSEKKANAESSAPNLSGRGVSNDCIALVWNIDKIVEHIKHNEYEASRRGLNEVFHQALFHANLRNEHELMNKQYFRMLKRILHSHMTVSADEKVELKAFRSLHHIEDNEHEALIRHFGWSKDEFESGERHAAAKVDHALRRLSEQFGHALIREQSPQFHQGKPLSQLQQNDKTAKLKKLTIVPDSVSSAETAGAKIQPPLIAQETAEPASQKSFLANRSRRSQSVGGVVRNEASLACGPEALQSQSGTRSALKELAVNSGLSRSFEKDLSNQPRRVHLSGKHDILTRQSIDTFHKDAVASKAFRKIEISAMKMFSSEIKKKIEHSKIRTTEPQTEMGPSSQILERARSSTLTGVTDNISSEVEAEKVNSESRSRNARSASVF